MLVTLARPTHRAALAELLLACRVEIDLDQELERPFARLWWARHSAEDPTALGLLLAWEVTDELHVIDVCTHPAERRRGVARALVTALLAHATAHRMALCILEVRRSNAAAIGLYRSAGFHAASVRRNYYSAPVEDAIEMHLRFDPATAKPVALPDEI